MVLLTGLGDVVMGLPVVNALKRARTRGGGSPGWSSRCPPECCATTRPWTRWWCTRRSAGRRGCSTLRRALAGRRFDLTLNLNIYFKSIWPTLFSGAPVRLGFGRDRARDGVWLAANRHLPPRPRRHTLDMFLEFPGALGVPVPAVDLRLTLTRGGAARSGGRFFAPLAERPVAAVVPASGEREEGLAAGALRRGRRRPGARPRLPHPAAGRPRARGRRPSRARSSRAPGPGPSGRWATACAA